MEILRVELGSRSYPILIGRGLLGERTLFEQHVRSRDILVVSNTVVAPLYLDALEASLQPRRVVATILPDGEHHKTLASVARVLDVMVANRFGRDCAVIALGGGVVGDIAGFAAACYQRGVNYVQVPTTLLAQVDSSVGGKTGVNHSGGKNLIGAFHQPIAVIADTDTLATLPDRELRAGLAEVIKYGCIQDPALFDWLDRHLPALLDRDADALTHAIARSCEIKAAVVAADEREHGQRAILNFGHTFGHAIEAATNYERFLHGEAVAIGMLMAADLSCRLGLISPAVKLAVRGLIERAGLPTEAPRIGAARALALMQMDKKVLAGNIRLVLLETLGRAVVRGQYPQEALEATLREHLG